MAIVGHSHFNFSRKDAAKPLILRTIYRSAHKAFSNFPRGAIATETGQFVRRAVKGTEVSEAWIGVDICRKGG